MTFLLPTIILLICTLPILASVIYLMIYKKRINKRLTEEFPFDRHTKPMMSPFKFFLIAMLIAVVIHILIILLGVLPFLITTNVSDLNSGLEETRAYIAEYDANSVKNSIMAEFSPEEDITGYERRECSDGDFRFVYYVRLDTCDRLFPEFMIYAEYMGREKYIESGFNAKFTEEHIGSGFRSDSEGEGYAPNGMWFTADTVNFSGKFTLKYIMYREEQTDGYTEETSESGVFVLDMEEIEKITEE